jgi:hypothetical protein
LLGSGKNPAEAPGVGRNLRRRLRRPPGSVGALRENLRQAHLPGNRTR